MDTNNSPKVKNVLDSHRVKCIPEAHCFVRYSNSYHDFTFPGSSSSNLSVKIEHQKIISPEQIGDYKINWHKTFMKEWGEKSYPQVTFEKLWAIREECINALS